MGAKNTIKKNKSNRWTFTGLAITTLAVLTISTYCFSSGHFIVHQNLFYIPIVISCMFFLRKGFVFSVILSLAYLSLILYFTKDSIIILQALIRVFVFVIIAGIITFLSIRRRRVEEKLLRTSAQLKSVINSSSQVSIISTDLSGRIVLFNSGAERMLGYSAEEMMDKTPVFYHLESEMTARGRELTKELGYPVEGFDVLVAYAKKGQHETREWTYVRKDGGYVIVNIAVTPVRNDSGQIIGFTGVANDITERKKMEEELRESKLKFKTIFDSSRDAVMLVTPEKGFFEGNPATVEIFGCKDKSEFIRMSPADLSPEYQPDGKLSAVKAQEMMATAMEKGSHFFEWTHKRVNGEEFFADVRLTRMKWENRMVLQATVRDITERIKSERAMMNLLEDLQDAKAFLESSISSFHNIVAKSTDGIIIVAKTGIVQFTNPAAETFLGNGGKKLVGQLFRFPIETGQTMEIDIIRDNNEPGIAEMQVVETKWNDNPAWLTLLRDITDRKLMEERLKKSENMFKGVATAVPVGIGVVTNRKITWANDHFMQLVGRTPEEIINRSTRILYVNDEGYDYIGNQYYKELREKGKAEIEIKWQHKDGRVIDIFLTGMPLDAQDLSRGIIFGALDITERKRVEEKIKEAMKTKSEFTSVVSHELRTPLTSIKEGIALVFDEVVGDINDEQKELLGIAKKNVDRLARLINNILDFQKLDSGKMKFNFEANNINEIIKDVYNTMAPSAKKAGLDILLELDDSLPQCSFDNDKITQVLINLFANAIKFTKAGNITIKTGRSSDSIRVSVSDTGCGIKKEDMSKIFNRFEQLGSGGERKTGGTGLGLAISREIIERHNGKIWFESTFGKGSIFTFTLPVCDTENLLRKYIKNGIKKASKNNTGMSLILISFADFDKLRQELSNTEINATLKDMEAVLENNLHRADNSLSRTVDNVFKLHNEIFVILADCNKENTLGAKSRLEQLLNNYLSDKNLADKIKILWGYAAYPDDAVADEDLVKKARESQFVTTSKLSV